ncbi:hypothetical protein [Candidatus Thiosymbion oneisti]|uniref:hypothetical protein n=1 Tax=Candidatus Thiosymbion oneisti TaxID=589554 RepID=UPI000B7CF015|nr:hypothetical protein [Candidatus Thiosymbion oneisti]
MRYALLLTLAGLLAGPASGSDCFCLQDVDDNLWFDCREQKRPSGIHVFCTKKATKDQTEKETKDQIELTERMDDLSRVPDGEPPCTPCRLDDVVDIDPQLRGD